MKIFTSILESIEMEKSLSFKEVELKDAANNINKFPDKYNLCLRTSNGQNAEAFIHSVTEVAGNNKLYILEILYKDVIIGYIGINKINDDVLWDWHFKSDYLHPVLLPYYIDNNDIINKLLNYVNTLIKNNKSVFSKLSTEFSNIPRTSRKKDSEINKDIQDLYNKYLIFYIKNVIAEELVSYNPYISFLDINYDTIKQKTNNFSSFDFIKTLFTIIKSKLIYNVDYDVANINYGNYNNYNKLFDVDDRDFADKDITAFNLIRGYEEYEQIMIKLYNIFNNDLANIKK